MRTKLAKLITLFSRGNFKVRYAVALLIIAILSTFLQVVVQLNLENQKTGLTQIQSIRAHLSEIESIHYGVSCFYGGRQRLLPVNGVDLLRERDCCEVQGYCGASEKRSIRLPEENQFAFNSGEKRRKRCQGGRYRDGKYRIIRVLVRSGRIMVILQEAFFVEKKCRRAG